MDATLMTIVPTANVAILGFGARAANFAALLAPRGVALRAWDAGLATAQAQSLRARIESAGVDVVGELASALRGARLVVLDAPAVASQDLPLHAGQRLLDLAHAPAAEVNAVLMALGVPSSQARWEDVGEVMAPPPAITTPSAVRRGELP
jgi:hypothetical protein